MSGIFKKPVSSTVEVNRLGLKGDEQADLSVHGGLSKAIYAYPSEHYPYWEKQMLETGVRRTLPYGFMGENLTLSGLIESEVYVGDELHFENCILRITQPRKPCFKFNAVMGDKQASKKMVQTGYCGFYLSVVETGVIRAGEHFTLISGNRMTSLESLFKVSSLQTKND